MNQVLGILVRPEGSSWPHLVHTMQTTAAALTGSQGYNRAVRLTAYPGGDLVEEGLTDLAQGRETIPALLVSIGALRLRRLGLPVAEGVIPSPEDRLYERLAESDPDSAHSRYNALVQRLVSFENAAECAGL